jgi:hypothetical protein
MICLSANVFKNLVGHGITPSLFIQCCQFHNIDFRCQRIYGMLSIHNMRKEICVDPYTKTTFYDKIHWNVNQVTVLYGNYGEVHYGAFRTQCIYLHHSNIDELIKIMQQFCKLKAFI